MFSLSINLLILFFFVLIKCDHHNVPDPQVMSSVYLFCPTNQSFSMNFQRDGTTDYLVIGLIKDLNDCSASTFVLLP